MYTIKPSPYTLYWLCLAISLLRNASIHATSTEDDDEKYCEEPHQEKHRLLILSNSPLGVQRLLSIYGYKNSCVVDSYKKNPKQLLKTTSHLPYAWLKNLSDLTSITTSKSFESATLHTVVDFSYPQTSIQGIMRAHYACYSYKKTQNYPLLYIGKTHQIASLIKTMYQQNQISCEFYNIYNPETKLSKSIDITEKTTIQLYGRPLKKNDIPIPDIFCLSQDTSKKPLLAPFSDNPKVQNKTQDYTLYIDEYSPFYITHTNDLQQTIADCLQRYGTCILHIQKQDTANQIKKYSSWFAQGRANRKNIRFFTVSEDVYKRCSKELIPAFDQLATQEQKIFFSNVTGMLTEEKQLVKPEIGENQNPYLTIEDFSEKILPKASDNALKTQQTHVSRPPSYPEITPVFSETPDTEETENEPTFTWVEITGLILIASALGLWVHYQDTKHPQKASTYPTITRFPTKSKAPIPPQYLKEQPSSLPSSLNELAVFFILLLLILAVYIFSRTQQHHTPTT